jgi:hypothetical protein
VQFSTQTNHEIFKFFYLEFFAILPGRQVLGLIWGFFGDILAFTVWYQLMLESNFGGLKLD